MRKLNNIRTGGSKIKRAKKKKTKSELYPKNLPLVEKMTLIPPDVQANSDAYKYLGERYHDELD